MRAIFLYLFGHGLEDPIVRADSWLYLAVAILRSYDEARKEHEMKRLAKKEEKTWRP